MAYLGRDSGVQLGSCVARVLQARLMTGIVQEGASLIVPTGLVVAGFFGGLVVFGRLNWGLPAVEYSFGEFEDCCLFCILADARRLDPADAFASDCSRY